jgi:predicted Fe-Mo cluster-binding NifX family protein
MKIAVTSSGAALDADVDPRFGRCPYYLVVDTESMAFDALENPNAALARGAGIQSAQLLSEKGVRYVLTGDCGPNARDTLTAAEIGVILNCEGTAAHVIERFKAGTLDRSTATSASDQTGLVHARPGRARADAAQTGGVFEPWPAPSPAGPRRAGQGRGGSTGRGGGQGQGGGRGRGRKGGSGQGRGRSRGGGSQGGPA